MFRVVAVNTAFLFSSSKVVYIFVVLCINCFTPYATHHLCQPNFLYLGVLILIHSLIKGTMVLKLSEHLGEGILMISTQVELPHDAQCLSKLCWFVFILIKNIKIIVKKQNSVGVGPLHLGVQCCREI